MSNYVLIDVSVLTMVSLVVSVMSARCARHFVTRLLQLFGCMLFAFLSHREGLHGKSNDVRCDSPRPASSRVERVRQHVPVRGTGLAQSCKVAPVNVWRIVLIRHGQNGHLHIAKLRRRAYCRHLWFEQGCRVHVRRRCLQLNRKHEFQADGLAVSSGVRAWFSVRRQRVRTPTLIIHSLSCCTTTFRRPLPSMVSLCNQLALGGLPAPLPSR